MIWYLLYVDGRPYKQFNTKVKVDEEIHVIKAVNKLLSRPATFEVKTSTHRVEGFGRSKLLGR